MRSLIVIAVLATACERAEVKIVNEPERHAIGDDVSAKLLAGTDAAVPELGTFSIREYKPYEGRNPRTGEIVRVPGKRVAFFRLDDALREHLNNRGKAPTRPWINAMLTDLRAGKPVLFGGAGAFAVYIKPATPVRNPQTGEDEIAPAFAILLFSPSQQLRAALNGHAIAKRVDSATVDALFAKLPQRSPHTLAELDAALAELGVDYKRARIVEPSQREPDPFDDGITLTKTEDDDPHWILEGATVVNRYQFDDAPDVPLDRWAADMLVVAAVRDLANGALLERRDAERVIARLARDTPFTLADLPY